MTKIKTALFHPGWIVWFIFLPIAEAAVPQAQKGECLVSTDFYIVHFTAFQPPRDGGRRRETFRRYCHHLPRTGTTYFGIDFIDRDVRQLPIALKVVEERAGRSGEVIRTLKEISPRRYPQGVASLRVDFDRPGHYAVVVQFGEKVELAEDQLWIPLTVGLNSLNVPWLTVATVISIVLFFSMVSSFLLRFHRRGA